MVIVSRYSKIIYCIDTKSLIWEQIFNENLTISIAMSVVRNEFLKIQLRKADEIGLSKCFSAFRPTTIIITQGGFCFEILSCY